MIISVSNKTKSIPENKGLLFNLFIKVLFQRENQKKEQLLDVDSKFDFLSEVAFLMRRKDREITGRTREKISRFKKLHTIHLYIYATFL